MKFQKLEGYQRDKAILRAIEKHRLLSTEQVQALFFGHLSTGMRRAQIRLKALMDKGKVERFRLAQDFPYFYYLHGDEPSDQEEHLVSLNWMIIALYKSLHSWETVESLQYERDYVTLRADAVVTIRNGATGKLRAVMLEMDQSDTNQFDKVKKYNWLYENQEVLTKEAWFHEIEKFPHVFVATHAENRLKTIKKLITQQNKADVIFHVSLLQELVQGVFKKGGGKSA